MLDRLRAKAFGLFRPFVMLLAATAIGVYLVLGVLHLRYPYELEWMEGGIVDEILRVAAGQKIYVRPTLDYVPFLYAPLYIYVSAAFTKLLGPGFLAPRLVSYLASIGAIALIGRFVHRETRGAFFPSLFAAGLFAATYCQSAAFFDIARVDSLFLLLALGALYTLRFSPTPRGQALSALLLVLAFLTKQSASVLVVPMAFFAVLRDRKKAWIFGVCAIGGIVGSAALLDVVHGGWFSYFVLWLPRQHPLVGRMAYDFWILDLLGPLGIACLGGLFYLLVGATDPEARRFHALMAAGMLFIAWTGRLHAGGWPNVIMPGFAMIAILAGLGAHSAFVLAGEAPEKSRRIEALVLLAAALQLGSLVYDPKRVVPTAADRQAGDAFVASLRAMDGEVFLPAHGYLLTLAGKPTHAHEMAMEDILGIGGGKPGAALLAEVRKALKEKRFSVVIPDTGWHQREIDESYRRQRDAIIDPAAFFPVTGMRTRPKGVYLPR
ncbi:MAG: glycosyltransferase family 39 protein [Byssovorax sp.]